MPFSLNLQALPWTRLLPWIGALGATLIFAYTYATEPAVSWTTGMPAWHGWSDQTEYLRSASAFARLNFEPQNHNYPPLYALLASPLSRIWPNDPFIVLDAVCMAASAWLLVALFQRDLPRWIALFAPLLMLGDPLIRAVFVIPFTSTLVAPLLLISVLLLSKAEDDHPTPSHLAFWFALCIGLSFLTRPLDGVVAGLLVPFWLWLVIRQRRSGRMTPAVARRQIILLVAGGVIGPLLFVANNFIIFGRWKSNYMGLSKSLDIATIPQKFVSILLDSTSLYLDPGQAMLARLPWVLPIIGGVILCVLFGKIWQRAAATLVIVCVALYLSFTDLLPNGLFRYGNYHYFRWSILLGAMLTLIAAIPMVRHGNRLRRCLIGLVFMGAAALSGLHLNVTMGPVPVALSNGGLTIDVSGRSFDLIDLSPAKGDWAATYFADPGGGLDERDLAVMRDIKNIPSSTFPNSLGSGPGVNDKLRLLMLKRASGHLLTIRMLGKPYSLDQPMSAQVGRYNYGWGFPRWVANPTTD